NDLATATIETLKTNAKGATKTLAASLVEAKVITLEKAVAAGVMAADAPLAVASVTGKSASSFVVKFNKAVADTTKIATKTTRGTLTVSLTSTWNTEKTELTLASAGKLVQDTYKIEVKNDATVMTTAEVKIEQEKIAKIEFLSDTVVRANDWEGYVPVKITNQYGDDITTSPLASNITWTSSVDQVSKAMKDTSIYIRKGTVNPTTPVYTVADLKYMPIVVVTAFDNSSATYASATLKVSTTVGGIAQITFKGVVDVNGNPAEIVAGSVQKLFLQYEAVDAFGNKVDDYNTLTNTNVVRIMSSFANAADITIERDTTNNSKAVLVITQGPDSAVPVDMPVVFTAIAITSGKNATYSTTVKKAAQVASFNLLTPAEQVAAGETVTIPFVAIDQNGTEITSYSQLQGKISFSGAAYTETSSSTGAYVLKATFPAETRYMFTATVPGSGRMSNIQLDVKAAAKPTSLASITATYPALVTSAGSGYDFYGTYGGLTVKDQYDREYDMLAGSLAGNTAGKYRVTASVATADQTKLTVSGAAYNANAITYTAQAVPGTVNVTFTLVENVAGVDVTKDTQVLRLTVVEKKDIVDYAIASIATLYDVTKSGNYYTADGGATLTEAGAKMAESVTAYGKLAGGTKVRLNAGSYVIKTTDDSRFKLLPGTTAASIVSGAKIYATDLGSGVTEAKAKVYASVIGNGGIVSTPSIEVTAKTAAPVAADVYAWVDYLGYNSGVNNVTMSGDVISITAADLATVSAEGIYLFNTAGAETPWTNPYFYMEIEDSYGNYGMIPTHTTITQTVDKTATTASTATVNASGVVTWGGSAVEAGDEFILTTITSNGLKATYKIVVR
ncbi:MAG: cell wall-binding protein, partial [Anaerocolumna sp.]|nr:cell wall-binding protein [Anaerocolumna sp.]